MASTSAAHLNLPSFVELMDSLRLDNPAPKQHPQPLLPPRHHRSHRRTLSDSSVNSDLDDGFASVVLEPESPSLRDVFAQDYLFVPAGTSDIRLSRRSRDRYSPYHATFPHHRQSMPSLNDAAKHRPNRATSTSPLLSHSVGPIRQSASAAGSNRASARSSRSGSVSSWHEPSDTLPISSFVRRKSPRSPSTSPTAASFPAAVRDGPLAPVAIPALPILLPSFLPLTPPMLTPSSSSSTSTTFSELMYDGDDASPPLVVPEVRIE